MLSNPPLGVLAVDHDDPVVPDRLDDDVARQARDVVRTVSTLTAWVDSPAPAVGGLDSRNVDAVLDAAQARIAVALADARTPVGDRTSLSALLIRTLDLKRAARESGVRRRAEMFPQVQGVLDRLRPISTVADLIRRAPAELGRLGYDRCLISALDDGCWVARSAYVRDDPAAASAIQDAGSRKPRRLDRTLIESELVRRRRSILVADPRSNPRVHRELLAATRTRAYVAAPFVADRRVIGFVHVDAGPDEAVDEFDRDVIGMLSEALGYAFERAVYRERLRSVRRSIAEASSAVADLVDELVDGDLKSEGPVDHEGLLAVASATSAPTGERPNPERLTPRELEVMELLAAGHPNAKIASMLFVTEATVKAHVKHILRKVSAANRAEAVCKYLRAGHPRAVPSRRP